MIATLIYVPEINGITQTQPYVLVSGGQEIFKANTRAKCDRHAAFKGIEVVA